jgi:GT2 family glycosyltransferase
MTNPQVTIVVVPRERFSLTGRSLESIYEHSDVPFRLVYVDGGSPFWVRRYLERQAKERGFELTRTGCYLSPNQARNLGLQKVQSKYVVFMDNDVIVAPGWLTALVQCAEETGASVVSPLCCQGEPVHETIHFAGGEAHVRMQEHVGRTRRHMVETIARQGQRLADVRDQLEREPTEVAEFHCLLARRDVFDKIGPFDEGLLSVRENLDFCMLVRGIGGTVYSEPASVITYLDSIPFKWSDMPFYVVRWSDEWTLASLHRLRDKWNLTEDAYFTRQYKNLAWRRKEYLIQGTVLRRVPSARVRIFLGKLLFPVEEAFTRWAMARHEARQGRGVRSLPAGIPARG